MGFVELLVQAIGQVSTAMVPLVAALVIAQFTLLRLSAREFWIMMLGLVLLFTGLVLFLTGVGYGVAPIASELSGAAVRRYGIWPAVIIATILGFCTALAEPSVRVMSEHVQNTTVGSIPAKVITYSIVSGVAVFTGIAVLRVLRGVPLLAILGPGYVAALVLALVAERRFVSLAFDAGGVVTGPMIVAFLVSFVAGLTGSVTGTATLADAFGVVALVALAPILSLLLVGVVFRLKGGGRG